MLFYVYRRMRKGEEEKIDRFLQKTIGKKYSPSYIYYVVTTGNPENKRNRLIVGVLGMLMGIHQVAVADKWKDKNVLEFMLANFRDENQYGSTFITKDWRVVRALITAGWWWYSIEKNGLKFISRRSYFSRDPVMQLLYNLKHIPPRDVLVEKIKRKLFPPKPTRNPYILGEKVVSIFQYMKHDKEYRKFVGWKPTITLFSDDIRDIIPVGRQVLKLKDTNNPISGEYIRELLFKAGLGYEQVRNTKLTPFETLYDENGVGIVKRVAAYARKLGIKITSEELRSMGEYTRYMDIVGYRIEYEFVKNIDWKPKLFRTSIPPTSLEWEFYPETKHWADALFSSGHGYAIKFWTEGRFIGKTFMSAENDALYIWGRTFYAPYNSNISFNLVIDQLAEVMKLKSRVPILSVAPNETIKDRRQAMINPPVYVLSRKSTSEKAIYVMQWYKNWNGKETTP